MKILPSSKSLLLYYSTVASLFFTLSGFVSVKEINNATMQIVFLPITMYLFLTTTHNIRQKLTRSSSQKDSATPFKSNKSRTLFFAVLYILFLVIAVFNLTQSGRSAETPTTSDTPTSENPMIFKVESDKHSEEQFSKQSNNQEE